MKATAPALCPRHFGAWLRLQMSRGLLPWGPEALPRLVAGEQLVGVMLVGSAWPPAPARFVVGSEGEISTGFTIAIFLDAMRRYIEEFVPRPPSWAPTSAGTARVLQPLLEGGYMPATQGASRAHVCGIHLPHVGWRHVHRLDGKVLRAAGDGPCSCAVCNAVG